MARTAAATLAVTSLLVAAAVPAGSVVAGAIVPQSQDDQVQIAKKGSFDITEIDTP